MTEREIIAYFLIENDSGQIYEDDEEAFADADRLLEKLKEADK